MRVESRGALRFASVALKNWKNFRDADVEVQRRVFLFGANASGKSNFLDAFRFLRDIVSVGGGFQEAIARRGGVSKLRCLAARQYPDVEIKVAIADADGALKWEYELAFTQDNRRRPALKREIIRSGSGATILDRPDSDDSRDAEQLRQTHLEQVRVNRAFRELGDFFRSIEYLHIVPQLVRDPDRYRGGSNDPFGWDFLEKIAKTPDRTRTAWLKRIRDALRVAVPQLKELESWKDARGVPHLRGKYEHWRPKGAWQTEEAFSDGTLRLMGLMWAVLNGYGPLLLEEPELSLHPDVVRHIPAMLYQVQRRTGRQIFISSHSTDLIADEGIGLDEVLLLLPSKEGTNIRTAASYKEIKILLASGIPLADTILPRTRPKHAEQLTLFGEP